MSEQPELEFIPAALARPPVEVVDAMVVAAWELRCEPHDDRVRGALHAGQWLGQARRYAPVSGEDRAPVAAAVRDEQDQAEQAAHGALTGPYRVDVDYARGVAQMLAYATDPAAPQPVELAHGAPSSPD